MSETIGKEVCVRVLHILNGCGIPLQLKNKNNKKTLYLYAIMVRSVHVFISSLWSVCQRFLYLCFEYRYSKRIQTHT